MPQRVNGCGTWYYGKRNREQYTGTCRMCGRATTLTSYDTTLFVSILFVPTIPLGAKRIVEQCGACRRHNVLKMSDWLAGRQRIGDTITAFRAAPTDPGLAKEALTAAVGYRDLPTFTDLATLIEKSLADHGPTLSLLSTAYTVFGQTDPAERVARRAVEIDDTAEAREALAAILLRRGQPDEAAPYLQHIVDQGIPDRVGLVYQLAQHYQARGEHESALAAFDQCEAINPKILQDKTFLRLRAESKKRLGSARPVALGSFARKQGRIRSGRRLGFGAGIVAAIAAVIYLASAVFIGFEHKVYLVNGLSRAYTVRLNGSERVLPPRSVTPIRLAEGRITVEILGAPPGVTPGGVSLHTPFFSRPFDKTAFVINPDETAILDRKRVYYTPANSGRGGRRPDESFTTGQLFSSYPAVDFAFVPFPQTLQLDSQAPTVEHRDGVQLLHPASVPDTLLLEGIADKVSKSAVANAAARHVLLEPQREDFLPLISQWMPSSDVAALMRPGLDARPLRMNWHRTYQEAMSSAGHDQQLEQEYATRLAADPTNPELMYLAGRAARDYDRSLQLYRQATQGPNPCGYAYYSLCGSELESGHFTDAADWGELACTALGQKIEVRYYARQAMLAAGRFQRASDMARADETGPLDQQLSAFDDEWYALCLTGQTDAATMAIERCHNNLHPLSPDEADTLQRRQLAELQYVGGQTDAFFQLLAQSRDHYDQFLGHLATGDAASADSDLQAVGEHDAEADALLYLVADKAASPEIASRHWDAAAAALAHGDFDERTVAAAMTPGPSAPPVATLLHSRITTLRKSILLAAIARHDPALRGPCAQLARHLNFDRRFPGPLITAALADLPAPPSP